MNYVEPIRDINLIYDIADYLREYNEKYYVMFMFGIYSGLRISDTLKLRVRDVKDKDYIFIHEQKTNKDKRFPIHDELKEILDTYTANKNEFEYLFKSRQGTNKPLTRIMVYQVLNQAAKHFGLSSIGCHTMRKTFGYFLYQQTKDIVAIKEILNHSSISITLRYIGMIRDTTDRVMKSLSFKRNEGTENVKLNKKLDHKLNPREDI